MSGITTLCLSVAAASTAQVLLRRGVRVGSAQTSARSSRWWLRLLASPWVWSYGILFVAAMGLWVLALSRIDLSYAFPLLSAGYILVALLSRFILKESLSWRRWLAIGVISVGVCIIAIS